MNLDAVAKTALITAAERAVETERNEMEGRLFTDPFARVLAGDEGFFLLERGRAELGDQPPAVALRTRYFDDRILHGLDQGIRQVVLLAAGLDARAYRLTFPEGTRLFELDRQGVLSYKQEKLGNASAHCERRMVGVDLQGDWQGPLADAGMDRSRPTLWLMEGLLMYLEEAEVLALFAKIDLLSAPKSVLLFDVLGKSLLDSPNMAKQLQLMEKLGAPWRFGSDEPEQLMDRRGWKSAVLHPGEVEPTRWPYPIPPRNVPKVPRGFLVEAQKP